MKEHSFNRGTARYQPYAALETVLCFHDIRDRRVYSCVLLVEMDNIKQAQEFFDSLKSGCQMKVNAGAIFDAPDEAAMPSGGSGNAKE